MPDVYCVRADFGTYAKQFVAGRYAANDIALEFETHPGGMCRT